MTVRLRVASDAARTKRSDCGPPDAENKMADTCIRLTNEKRYS